MVSRSDSFSLASRERRPRRFAQEGRSGHSPRCSQSSFTIEPHLPLQSPICAPRRTCPVFRFPFSGGQTAATGRVRLERGICPVCGGQTLGSVGVPPTNHSGLCVELHLVVEQHSIVEANPVAALPALRRTRSLRFRRPAAQSRLAQRPGNSNFLVSRAAASSKNSDSIDRKSSSTSSFAMTE